MSDLTAAEERVLLQVRRDGHAFTSWRTGPGTVNGQVAHRLIDRDLLQVINSYQSCVEVTLTPLGASRARQI